MLINQIINVEVTSGESPPASEPVALQEMKEYLRLEDSDSPADEFDFDDDLITDLIQEGREYVEKNTGIHVIPKILEVTVRCESGGLEFPGPVTSDITLTDLDGNEVDDPVWIGTKYPILKDCYSCELVATYNAGYSGNSPSWVKDAIKAYVAWAYENRGDEAAGSPQRAAAIIRSHRRLSAWG